MRRWAELKNELDERGIRVVTVCTDTPDTIRKRKGMHGLEAVMLSDPDLALTDRFGLRNQGLTVRPPGLPGLPAPTTLLVGEDGLVRWVDQSEHYVQRSDPDRVRSALTAAFA